jgi:diguanylate cyclase (GGDEF)-like protein/PAS domain S-box-containing protein
MILDRLAEFEDLPAETSAALLVAAEVADSSDDAIGSTSLDGTITSWNPAAERLYGWTAAEAIGQNIEMIVPEAQRSEHSMFMDRLARGERVDHLETTRSRKDDFRVQVSLTIAPIDGSDGQLVGATWIAHDITGRQRSEQIRALFAAIVESAEDAMFSTDLQGYVTSWNGSAERLFGYGASEMVGRFYGEILEGEELEDFEQVFARVMAGERLSYHDTTRTRRDGTKFDVSMSLSPIFAPDGSVVGKSAILHEITERKQRERDLAENRGLIEQAQRIAHLGGWVFAVASNGPLICTSEVFRIFGAAERPNLTLEDYFARVHPDDLERVRSAALSAIAQEGHYELEHRIVRPDGTQRWVFTAGDVLTDATGEPVELLGVVQDITDRREAEEKARSVEMQLSMLAENSRDLIFRYRILPDPGFEFVSPASVVLTGYAPDEFYAQSELINRLVDPSSRDLWLARVRSGRAETTVDVELVRKDGSRIWVNQSLGAVLDADGEVIGIDGITRDISDRKAAELQLEHETLHDPLTGLPNRLLLMDRIEHGLPRATRENGSVALLFIDLDRFKVFNDTRGHSFGDAVLRAVATRLVASLRSADTVGRFSGDEFIVVSEKLLAGTDVLKIADHTLNSFAAPFDIAGEEVHVTASIGIATGKAGQSADKLLRDADLAMHRAKDLGRARYEVFDDTLRAEAERRSTIETGLRRGLDNHEFALAFQPVWSMIEERFIGAEALLRWHDQDLGTIGPAEFIPVAEDCGLIVPIGEWVLEQACNALALANRAKSRQTASTMSVNVSAVQLRSSDFIRALEELISATGIEPKLLCLEITESVLMEDIDYFSKVLHELRAFGTRLSIDDFGTGYSSLAYLRRFTVDELKIDQSFIADMDVDPYAATLVAAVIAIGEVLGLRVIAEGVETAEELAAVRDLGCQYAQGYLFARPCSFDVYMEYLKGGRPGG